MMSSVRHVVEGIDAGNRYMTQAGVLGAEVKADLAGRGNLADVARGIGAALARLGSLLEPEGLQETQEGAARAQEAASGAELAYFMAVGDDSNNQEVKAMLQAANLARETSDVVAEELPSLRGVLVTAYNGLRVAQEALESYQHERTCLAGLTEQGVVTASAAAVTAGTAYIEELTGRQE